MTWKYYKDKKRDNLYRFNGTVWMKYYRNSTPEWVLVYGNEDTMSRISLDRVYNIYDLFEELI